jgi:hypothetical protein
MGVVRMPLVWRLVTSFVPPPLPGLGVVQAGQQSAAAKQQR